MEKEGPSRALVVFGSESGTAEKAIKELAAQWKAAGNWQVVDVIDGNAAAKQGLETLAANHDAIVVATSSFRQGDAPYNYDDFLGALYRATFKAESPFQGCQHAVLGFGDSHFDTYMNCPRLTDKLMGALGSKRMLARVEVDENETLTGDEAVAKWAKDVVAAFSKTCKADVCDWTVPEDQILDKKSDLVGSSGGGVAGPLVALGVAGAAAAYYYMYLM